MYPEARRVCVVCGSGNNGGDGFVAARHLAGHTRVSLVLLSNPANIRTPEARANWARLSTTKVEVVVAEDVHSLDASASLVEDSDVIVDAIVGTGVAGGALREPLARAVRLINSAKGAKVAVDVPSGLDPGTGVAAKDTVEADVTVTFHLPKVGMRDNQRYTGELLVASIGIASDARNPMMVLQIPVGPMRNFAYILADKGSRDAMVIDSGWETEPIVGAAKENGFDVKYVCATHGHFDHVKTIDALARELGAKTVAHEKSSATADLKVREGDVLRLGGSEVRVIHTPGHTVDSVCYFDGKDLFTGDTLFVGAWGRTDLAGGSAKTLYQSLREKILVLPMETTIYSGHDYGGVPFRTLGEEARTNPALLAKSAEEFVRMNQD